MHWVTLLYVDTKASPSASTFWARLGYQRSAWELHSLTGCQPVTGVGAEGIGVPVPARMSVMTMSVPLCVTGLCEAVRTSAMCTASQALVCQCPAMPCLIWMQSMLTLLWIQGSVFVLSSKSSRMTFNAELVVISLCLHPCLSSPPLHLGLITISAHQLWASSSSSVMKLGTHHLIFSFSFCRCPTSFDAAVQYLYLLWANFLQAGHLQDLSADAAGIIYEVRVYSLEAPTLGEVLHARQINAAHCLTSVQFSPTSEHLLLAYGRSE